MHPPYYRGCWHGVSRCFLLGYCHYSSPRTGLYNPKAFIIHAVFQGFPHCAIFPRPSRGVAPSGFRPLRKIPLASRRSLGRVSVPVWLIILSSGRSLGRVSVPNVADRPLRPAKDRCLGEPLPHQQANLTQAHLIATQVPFLRRDYSVLVRVSPGYPQL